MSAMWCSSSAIVEGDSRVYRRFAKNVGKFYFPHHTLASIIIIDHNLKMILSSGVPRKTWETVQVVF